MSSLHCIWVQALLNATVLALATGLGGCSTTLPALEGARVRLVSNESSQPALDVFSRVDVAYQLDPKNYGECGRFMESPVTTSTATKPNDQASPPVAVITADRAVARIRCALDGFHSPRYFTELEANELTALRVSNVAYSYAEKQASRISDLSKKISDVVSKLDGADSTSVSNLRRRLETDVLNQQIDDLTDRVKQASASSQFLEHQRRRRNGVQASLISASDAACDQYKRNLNNEYSTSNFNFGSTATLAGGLGAAVSDLGIARGLAAISGITSGVRAEYNDAFFRNKVVELLTKAMDISRNRKREEIRRRSVQILADYSMENAIGDAILYNSQCSLVAGLQETSESLQTVSDPGLKWLANAFGGAASNKDLTSTLFRSLGQAVGTVQAIQKSTEDQNTLISSGTESTSTPTITPPGSSTSKTTPAATQPIPASPSSSKK